ncbi:hypothetical protein LCN94_01450 [Ruminococcus sp. FMB-CY1]|jgi:hypothetical protein|uniref:hypothetical protein n=1 Tax=unclassified Ruminococcus TaxID=2608920 RepID=UPI00205C0634|nr:MULTISPECIES: hypothetical protein [unclassified Ruminococcus]USP68897.1 hypothetical protein KGF34_06855 [Ruminococcus sp. FMBCY1]WBX57800.1 hypothetical protein LCN94_01450 [Ruminococcus sp. FMB-CY1]DAE90100.1 MAG TPA: hypothetical protein [Caudoviricetes sp.]
MTAEEIKEAFINREPVVLSLPNMIEKRFDSINAVIYRRSQKGRMMVSVELVDMVQTDMGKRQHLIVARGANIKKER